MKQGIGVAFLEAFQNKKGQEYTVGIIIRAPLFSPGKLT